MWLIAFMAFNNIYKLSSLCSVFTCSAVLVNSDLYVRFVLKQASSSPSPFLHISYLPRRSALGW